MDFELTSDLLQSGVQSKREAAARSLGRHLAAQGSGEWLIKFKRLTSKLLRTASADYDRGFLDALELVATGFERQASEDQLDEQALVRIKTRAHWLPALRLLSKGPLRPSDLAERLGVQRSLISRLLDVLEASALITRVQEGKERPCRLSPHARALLSKLPVHEEIDSSASEQIVGAVFRCIGVLVRDGRAGRARLLSTLQEDVKEWAPSVLGWFEASLRRSALGFVDDDDALVATEGELHSRIAGHLSLGCAGKPSRLVDQLKSVTEGGLVFLRAGDRQQEWDVLANRHLKHLRVMREQDLQLDPPPPGLGYGVIYEGPSLVAHDRESERGKPFIHNAHRRFCLGVQSGSQNGFQTIEVSVPELAAA